MIVVNNKVVEPNKFPDGTFNLKGDFPVNKSNEIAWKYEREEELVMLIYITNYIKDRGGKYNWLRMFYCPNARMDRVKDFEDVFTLKYFANIINSLGFDEVEMLDPHSPVSMALINNATEVDLKHIIDIVIKSIMEKVPNISSEEIIIYLPDNGALHKYEDMFIGEHKICYGTKHRDWKTGEIKGLEVVTNGIDLKDKTVLMLDDICSFGGTLYYSTLKLKELGAKHIYAYTSHTENSILDKDKGKFIKLLEDGTVDHFYTTDSTFSIESTEKITMIKF